MNSSSRGGGELNCRGAIIGQVISLHDDLRETFEKLSLAELISTLFVLFYSTPLN